MKCRGAARWVKPWRCIGKNAQCQITAFWFILLHKVNMYRLLFCLYLSFVVIVQFRICIHSLLSFLKNPQNLRQSLNDANMTNATHLENSFYVVALFVLPSLHPSLCFWSPAVLSEQLGRNSVSGVFPNLIHGNVPREWNRKPFITGEHSQNSQKEGLQNSQIASKLPSLDWNFGAFF